MEVRGVVREEVVRGTTMPEEVSDYVLDTGTECYQIRSVGLKAVKDYLFVRKGQQMQVKGRSEGNLIYAEKERIELSGEK